MVTRVAAEFYEIGVHDILSVAPANNTVINCQLDNYILSIVLARAHILSGAALKLGIFHHPGEWSTTVQTSMSSSSGRRHVLDMVARGLGNFMVPLKWLHWLGRLQEINEILNCFGALFGMQKEWSAWLAVELTIEPSKHLFQVWNETSGIRSHFILPVEYLFLHNLPVFLHPIDISKFLWTLNFHIVTITIAFNGLNALFIIIFLNDLFIFFDLIV
jgi:hypothetical protein